MISIRWIVWTTCLLLLAGIVTASFHLSGTTLEYSRYNNEWNGTALLFQSFEERGAGDRVSHMPLSGSGDTLLLIMVPYDDFGEDEIREMQSFLSGGNVIMLVDDRESGNLLLAGLQSEVRIKSGNLSSIDRFYDHPSSVKAYPTGEDPLNSGVDQLVLNSPAYLEGGNTVFSSSVFSWIDGDGDGRVGSGETMGRFAVVAHESLGNGSLYVISDPSIFINGMQNQGKEWGNSRFIENILSMKDHILVDQIHSGTASMSGVIRVVNFIKDSIPIKMSLITVLILGIAWLFHRQEEGQ